MDRSIDLALLNDNCGTIKVLNKMCKTGEKRKSYKSEWNKKNSKKIKDYNKEYYEKNKRKILAKAQKNLQKKNSRNC